MADLWTMIGSADARLVFTALEELKKEALTVQNAGDVTEIQEKMETMQTTLGNVVEDVKTVNGFWSLSDQDLVRASLLEYASLSGKVRTSIRAKAGEALKLGKADKVGSERVLEQELAWKKSNEQLWISVGGFIYDGHDDVERLRSIQAQ